MSNDSVNVKQARAACRLPARSGSEDGQPASRAERLGNNTKSRAAFIEVKDQETHEIQAFTLDEGRREYVLFVDPQLAKNTARHARFSAQSSATKLLHNAMTPRDTPWRVTGCARRKIAPEVSILHSPTTGKAHFGNLMICGSVWTCPVCAAKISEGRKLEIKTATDAHMVAGGSLYMVTFTFSHQRHEDIADLMSRFSKARQWMRAQRGYKALRRAMGYVGDIRTLEVTYGDGNGWHPHEHGLWFCADRLPRAKLRHMMEILFCLWERACAKAGLGAPNRKRGVNIIECESAADYMAKMGREQKWGIASELSKQHIKVGKAKSMTPFDLLRSYEAGNKQHGALFLEYASAFFGKRQIIWSDGLKAVFGILIREDQDIAEDLMCEDAAKIATLSSFEWRVVLHQPFDVRATVLQLAENAQLRDGGGAAAVREFVERLVFLSELIPF